MDVGGCDCDVILCTDNDRLSAHHVNFTVGVGVVCMCVCVCDCDLILS